ncbi:MAG: hypothetical protein A2X78_00255 [Gammaproteobacteria bacterium GWE2_37_16]|nr:MAG: hypothetical protein A2X78_00255 [Gammaproteobacteria bacterium GWE2_37_16]
MRPNKTIIHNEKTHPLQEFLKPDMPTPEVLVYRCISWFAAKIGIFPHKQNEHQEQSQEKANQPDISPV